MTIAIALAALIVVAVAAVLVQRERRRYERLHAELRQDARDTQDLLDCARSFALACRTSAHDVRAALDEAIRTRVDGVDAIAIFQLQGRDLACVYAAPGTRLERYAELARYQLDNEHANVAVVAAARLGETVLLHDGVLKIHPADEFAVAVPLTLDRGNPIVVYAASQTANFAKAVPAIELIVEYAEPSLCIASEREDMERLATHDGLTGLLSRRSFDERYPEEVERCVRSGAHLALLFIDLDHFKAWNDTYGHASGDVLLQRISSLLQSMKFSPRDLVARLGGDEFAMVLLDVDKGAAVRRAIDIGAAVFFDDRSTCVQPDVQDIVQVSTSIGVAVLGRDALNAEDLLARADAIMYEAKGKNRADGGRDRVAYIDDNGEIARVQPSQHDRRDDSTRPFSDRRNPPRPFAESDEEFRIVGEAHG